MQTNIHEAIADGYYNARTGNMEEYAPLGTDPTKHTAIPPSAHPNMTLLVTDDKQKVVTRRVMDPTFGDKGDVRFAIRGTGPEAKRIADVFCEHINVRWLGPDYGEYDSKIIRLAREAVIK